MRLKKKMWQHRRDFTGLYDCEHCGHEQTMGGGYDDAYYHQNVIPRLKCGACGEAAAPDTPKTAPDVPEGVVL